MNAEDSTVISANKAHENYEQTLIARTYRQANALILGRLLKENRDEGLFKFLGYDDFNSYLGAPEFTFKRATAYKLIGLVELYVDKLNVPMDKLVSVGTTALYDIRKVVESDVDGWLDKAEHLSSSSLSEELGRGPVTISPPVPVPALGISSKVYLQRVKDSPCCVCGGSPATMAHFPRTKVRCEQPWYVIPLCGVCHRQQEDGGMTWCWENRQHWSKWFYDNICGE